jgi:hypothetical protein
MTSSRLNIDNIIDSIEKNYGISTFLDTLIPELMTCDSIAVMANRLPFKISATKLKMALGYFFPEIIEFYELAKPQRSPLIRKAIVPQVSDLAKTNFHNQFYIARYDPDHSVFKYFTKEWIKKFTEQRSMAKVLNNEFKFDFVEWIMWWVASGKIEERGIGNKYQMCRYDDTGPFSWDNCYCTTGDVNRALAIGAKREVEVI